MLSIPEIILCAILWLVPVGLLIYLAIGLRIGLGIIARSKKEIEIMKATVAALLAAVHAQSSVVASALTFQQGLIDKLREANDSEDPDAVGAALDELQGNTAKMAAAIAAGTPASDEVHVDDGGTGTAPVADGGTVVDTTTVDTTIPESGDAAGAGEGGNQSGAGAGEEAGDGAVDQGQGNQGDQGGDGGAQ